MNAAGLTLSALIGAAVGMVGLICVWVVGGMNLAFFDWSTPHGVNEWWFLVSGGAVTATAVYVLVNRRRRPH
jgi:hypothetical protein